MFSKLGGEVLNILTASASECPLLSILAESLRVSAIILALFSSNFLMAAAIRFCAAWDLSLSSWSFTCFFCNSLYLERAFRAYRIKLLETLKFFGQLLLLFASTIILSVIRDFLCCFPTIDSLFMENPLSKATFPWNKIRIFLRRSIECAVILRAVFRNYIHSKMVKPHRSSVEPLDLFCCRLSWTDSFKLDLYFIGHRTGNLFIFN